MHGSLRNSLSDQGSRGGAFAHPITFYTLIIDAKRASMQHGTGHAGSLHACNASW